MLTTRLPSPKAVKFFNLKNPRQQTADVPNEPDVLQKPVLHHHKILQFFESQDGAVGHLGFLNGKL